MNNELSPNHHEPLTMVYGLWTINYGLSTVTPPP